MKTFIRVLGLLFLAAMLMAAYNFFVFGSRAEPQAREAACAGRGPRCTAGLARVMRTPFWQDFQFRVGGKTVDVRCARSAYLFGEYRCLAR